MRWSGTQGFITDLEAMGRWFWPKGIHMMKAFMKRYTETVLLILFATAVAGSAGIDVQVDDATKQYTFADSGTPVLTYNFGTVPVPDGVDGKYAVARSNYIHPLYGPNGEILTADYSKDHPHHRGIYWAWPEVMYKGQKRDLHALQGVFARPGRIVSSKGGILVAENVWKWSDSEPIVRETATIRTINAGSAGRYVDLTLRFEALEDGVSLARRGTDRYGGLNIRLASIKGMTLAHHADPSGSSPRMAWQMASGSWGDDGAPLSLVVFEHGSNPSYPGDYVEYPKLPWFQPTFPRAGSRYALKKSRPLTLRYRLWVCPDKSPGEQALRDAWTAYQESNRTSRSSMKSIER